MDYYNLNVAGFLALPDRDANYWALLAQWQEEQDKLNAAKNREMHLRTMLVEVTFGANREEGSTTHIFVAPGSNVNPKNAAKLTVKQPYGRTLDPAAVTPALAALTASVGQAVADQVIRFKPDLSVSAYKALTAEQQLLIAPALTTKPGSPQLEFKPQVD